MAYDVAAIRAQFPTLERKVYGNKPLIFLDSAASAQVLVMAKRSR